MNDLRQAIIDSLDSCATDNTDIRETVQNLVENEGEETYPILLNVLTHLEFSTQDAKLNWVISSNIKICWNQNWTDPSS